MEDLDIDSKSYYLSGWKQWTPCIIEPYMYDDIL